MKYLNLLLLFFLTSCALSVGPVPVSTLTPEIDIVGTLTSTVTPDPNMGSIEGDFSWLESANNTSSPIPGINLEINGHTGNQKRYATRVDQNGHFTFGNIEPGDYGFGIYLNLRLSEKRCDAPEYVYGTDLGWEHYATWLKVEVFYDILFSSKDVVAKPGETVVLDFVLKCP